jgi:hypothetical protein
MVVSLKEKYFNNVVKKELHSAWGRIVVPDIL